MSIRRRAGIAALLLAGLAPVAQAGMQEDPVLTVTGAVAVLGDDAHFDLDELKSLPAVSFRTSTIWTDGVATFTGVPLQALLDAAGASGRDVDAIALNNYSVTIPIESIDADSPIVAYAIDGAPFPRRDKGPLWIVYPFDKSADFRNELIYGRSIWQLRTLTVK